jgi:ABC-type nitrate/sulfonate/bicarbonate transport system ATPase subunit
MTAGGSESLQLSEIAFTYSAAPRSFSLTVANLLIRRGEVLFLHGRSGCGKTTLLNLLAGTIKSPVAREVRRVLPNIGYVMHEPTLLPWLTIKKNIGVEERLRGRLSDLTMFDDLCMTFGLPANVYEMLPGQLSLGMRQRIEIAKAMCFRPDLLLLDEALSGIDAVSKASVIRSLGEFAHASSSAIVGIAHQLSDLLRLAERIYVIEKGRISRYVTISDPWDARVNMTVQELFDLKEARLMIAENLV